MQHESRGRKRCIQTWIPHYWRLKADLRKYLHKLRIVIYLCCHYCTHRSQASIWVDAILLKCFVYECRSEWFISLPGTDTRNYTGFTLSVRLSVCPCLLTKWCPLCTFHNTSQIHFLFTQLINQLHKMCHMLFFFKMSFNFADFLKFHNYIYNLLSSAGCQATSQEWMNGPMEQQRPKGIWIDTMSDPLYDLDLWPNPWPWAFIFKVKFSNSCISGLGGPIDMERKAYESKECWTCYILCAFTHDLALGFTKSYSKIAVSGLDMSGSFAFINIKAANSSMRNKKKAFMFFHCVWGIPDYFVVSLI